MSDAESHSDAIAQQFSVPMASVYCNGFGINLTNTDLAIMLLVDNVPQMKIHLSFTTAKTMSHGLGQAIAELEKITGRQIMKSTDIADAISKVSEAT